MLQWIEITLLVSFLANFGCMAGTQVKDQRYKAPVTHDEDHTAHEEHQDTERMNGKQEVWPEDVKISLSWDKVDESGLLGYRIYAYSETVKTPTPISDVSLDASNGVNPEDPSINLSVKESSMLTISIGEKVCFQVSALASSGESELSDKTCIQLEAPL